MIDRKYGLVISNPVLIEGSRMTIKYSCLDPQELRHSLLLWDELVWPSNNLVGMPGSQDDQFLEQIGVLARPRVEFRGSFDVATAYAHAHIASFAELNNKEPRKWSLAQGETSFLLQEGVIEKDRGCLVALYRAIPVPDKDVPLQDILDFKEKHVDELRALRSELGELYIKIINCEDEEFIKRQ